MPRIRPHARAAAREFRASRSTRCCSCSTPLRLTIVRRVADHRNEHIGNPRCAHVAELLQLPPVRSIEEQRAAAEDLALVDRSQLPRGSEALRMQGYFGVAPLEFLHAAGKHD